jgi:DNA-binding XRE family transcriptional regulator
MKQKMRKLLSKYGQTQKDLADVLGLTYQSVSIKLNGHKDFTQSEIYVIMVIYSLTPDEVIDIFFQKGLTPNPEKSDHELELAE